MTGGPEPDPRARAAVERAFREQSGRALATLARLLGDLSAAEDAVQEAFVEALRTWPARGVPDKPGAWITTTARNRALDRARRESSRPGREQAAALAGEAAGPDLPEVYPVADDQLRLIFTCCHPALAPAAQVGLTLRLVCGLQTSEIARAFLQPEPTVAQRLSRAKAKIRTAAIPFRVPPAHLLPERVPPVLACVYLVFSEGYAATAGDALIRHELCDEALRLARSLVTLMPDEPEARGLLALILLQDSRPATWCCWRTRTAPAGTRRASPRAWTSWPGRGGPARRGPTACRRPSPPSTPGHRRGRPPTGRGSPASTATWPRWRRRPWSS